MKKFYCIPVKVALSAWRHLVNLTASCHCVWVSCLETLRKPATSTFSLTPLSSLSLLLVPNMAKGKGVHWWASTLSLGKHWKIIIIMKSLLVLLTNNTQAPTSIQTMSLLDVQPVELRSLTSYRITAMSVLPLPTELQKLQVSTQKIFIYYVHFLGYDLELRNSRYVLLYNFQV